MGKGIVFVVFVIGFVIFALIKFVLIGTKAAYEAVFDPNAKDERAKKLIAECMVAVDHVMREKYTKQPGELGMAILQLTPAVQSMILDRGYQVNSGIARAIVCDAIVVCGHATREEVDRA